MIVCSTISPQTVELVKLENNIATYKLRQNIINSMVGNMLIGTSDKLYSYDELTLQVTYVENIEQQINDNFEIYWNLAFDKVKKDKIVEMSSLCEYKIINEFYSDCLGEIKRFDCTLLDQQNISGLVSVAMAKASGSLIEEILRWKASGEPICYEWTSEQIMKLGLDLHKHKNDCIVRFEELRIYINDTNRTLQDLLNLTWDTQIG